MKGEWEIRVEDEMRELRVRRLASFEKARKILERIVEESGIEPVGFDVRSEKMWAALRRVAEIFGSGEFMVRRGGGAGWAGVVRRR